MGKKKKLQFSCPCRTLCTHYDLLTSDDFNRVQTVRLQQASTSKSGTPTQDIALLLHSSTRMLMACQKENKKI